jgi:hypothetical protein
MTDEILGQGAFKSHADTPALELIAHHGALTQTLEVDEYRQGARYEIAATDLNGGKLKATLLLPVSGHVGLAQANQYKNTNVYNLVLNGRSLGKVSAKDYVTEHKLELSLKPGRNLVEFWPDGSGGVGGYKGGRQIEIDVK